MGRSLVRAVGEAGDMRLAGAVGRGDDLPADCDAVVDFTAPDASLALAGRLAGRDNPPALVTGTTGFDETQLRRLEQCTERVPILWSPNTSPGVNLMLDLVRQAARALAGYQTEIAETHHAGKRDAPSGTALALAEAVAAGRGAALDAEAIHSTREGEVFGEHSVIWEGESEVLEIRHRALDRMIFARGALLAARWLVHQPAGRLYRWADIDRPGDG
ncbi:MAG: 4-hydroxy-tetrahydrodipicolinate reductase [Gammaproteobacteria bacterium AqS3]|nr:4-hydroxy-tetrahydrodipicolinate reductase [Gammaproteobacteria bacterium AqS3]